MRYLSTRGESAARGFSDILLEGLAPDGGLYLPEHYPQVSAEQLARWRGLSYADLAFEVLSLYIDDVPADDLRALIANTYTPEVFGQDARIVPLKPLKGDPGMALLGLSQGPTLAFKDIAMQLLGNLFEYALARQHADLNILGATSGDTGSAAEYAMRGKRGIRVFMLSPFGKMSAFQTAQMFSLTDANIHNIAVQGVFDDCQDMVKAVSNDLDFKRRWRIGTVNSINWARLAAQIVYYFAGYFQATRSNDQQVSFTVPSGNFGNICAGHIARSMGLPIRRLVLATNENDVLDEFFRTGIYRPRKSAETHHTSSPSMDISKASNFERFIFDLLGRDAGRTADLFSVRLGSEGFFDLSADPAFARVESDYGFASGSSSHADRLATIRSVWQDSRIMIDTHTADGVKVAREQTEPGVPMLVLETALPAKFPETIREALGCDPQRPAGLDDLEMRPQRFAVMPAEVDAIKSYIAAHCSPETTAA
jgi:threonine synthase